MPNLTYVALLQRQVDSYLTGVTDLDVRISASGDHVLYATSRSGEAISVFAVESGGIVSLADHQTLTTDANRTDFISIGGIDYIVTLAPQEDSTRLYALDGSGQLIGGALSLSGETVAMRSLVQMQIGQENYLYCTNAENGALDAFRVGPDGRLAVVETSVGSTSAAGLSRANLGSSQFLVIADADGEHVRSYRVGNDGTLTEGGVCGVDQGLGVAGISMVEHVGLRDGHYVVIAARDSSSISVLRMEPDGSLQPVDHIIDDLNTRFQHVTSLETVTLGDRAFVIAGGADDGVSFFELLPGGRLLLHDTIPDGFTTTLANVSAIGATAMDGQLQIFIGSGTETGVTQLNVHPGPVGASGIGTAAGNALSGTTAGEVLAGLAGNDSIDGGAGDDVLMDGSGRDTLIGGEGRDVFVLEADGTYDEIRDFNPAQDRIDLTAWPMLRNLGQINFSTTSNGAILRFGAEELRVFSHDGLPLAQNLLLTNSLIGLTRVPASPPQIDETQIVFAGDDSSNVIVANDLDNIIDGGLGDDRLTGGAGEDTFVYTGGADVIEDFSGDILEIDPSVVSGSFASVLSSANVVGGNLVLDFGGGNTLTLNGLTNTAALNGRITGVLVDDPSHDVNGDGTSDILLRNSSGALGYYDMDGGVPIWQGLGGVGLNWSIAGTGDFDGDGTDDILWRHSNGAVGFYDMDGGGFSWQGLGTVSTIWSVVGTGDFDGDGTDDILWRHSNGAAGYYDMNGGGFSWQGLGTVSSIWSVVGTGDFDGDGTDDILWRNVNNGSIGMYEMDNGSHSWTGLGPLGLHWDVQGQFIDEFVFS